MGSIEWQLVKNNSFYILLTLMILANATGLFNEVFLADSSLYAGIARSFAESGNYLDIYVEGKDWLDKPHFPFWVAALSMKVFGTNAFAYKLPSFLFFLMALYYTYALAKTLYSEKVAQVAVLILGSSFHILISNSDVRAEGILLGSIIGACYCMYRLIERLDFKYLMLAAVYSSIAIMTKGVFVEILIFSAIFGHLVFTKQFRELFKPKWVVLLLLTTLLITPELYALYTQFDLHPEKTVFGKTGVSGIKFFVWDSQFGRFFNTGPIKGTGDPAFFLHTFLWAFAPWALLAILALMKQTRDAIKGITQTEWLNYFGFTVMFLVFSASKFQLPHYTNILFSFISILAAKQLVEQREGGLHSVVNYIFKLHSLGFLGIVIGIEFLFKPDQGLGPAFSSMAILVLAVLFLLQFIPKLRIPHKPALLAFFGVLMTVVYLNARFYPSLHTYQSGMMVAQLANETYPDKQLQVTHKDWSIWFYANTDVTRINKITEVDTSGDALVFANEDFLTRLNNEGVPYHIIKTFEHFHITKLKPTFINSNTRSEAVRNTYLVAISGITSRDEE